MLASRMTMECFFSPSATTTPLARSLKGLAGMCEVCLIEASRSLPKSRACHRGPRALKTLTRCPRKVVPFVPLTLAAAARQHAWSAPRQVTMRLNKVLRHRRMQRVKSCHSLQVQFLFLLPENCHCFRFLSSHRAILKLEVRYL